MPVCPKCGFSGQDQDSCERCGIIYARMHTILDARPATFTGPAKRTISGPIPRIQSAAHLTAVPSDPPTPVSATMSEITRPPVGGSPPSSGTLRALPAIAQAFPGLQTTPRRSELTPAPIATRTEREITLVPIVVPPKPQGNGRLLALLVIFVVCAGVWGLSQWRIARALQAGPAVQEPADSEYFDIRLSQIIEDTKSQLRVLKDLEQAARQREGLQDRVRFLRIRLDSSTLTDERRAAMAQVLDDLQTFLKTDVGAAIAAAQAERSPQPAATRADGGLELAFEKPGDKPDPAKTAVAPGPGKGHVVDFEPLSRIADEIANLPQ